MGSGVVAAELEMEIESRGVAIDGVVAGEMASRPHGLLPGIGGGAVGLRCDMLESCDAMLFARLLMGGRLFWASAAIDCRIALPCVMQPNLSIFCWTSCESYSQS